MKSKAELDAQIKIKLGDYLNKQEWKSLEDLNFLVDDDERARIFEVLKSRDGDFYQMLREIATDQLIKEQFDSMLARSNGEAVEEDQNITPKKLEIEVIGEYKESDAAKEYHGKEMLYSNAVQNSIAKKQEFYQDPKDIIASMVSEEDKIKEEYVLESYRNRKESMKQLGIKKIIPNYKKLHRSQELLLEALAKAIEEHKNLDAVKWGIVIEVAQDERLAFQYAARKLAALDKIKLLNIDTLEFGYKGYRFYIAENQYLSHKVMLSFMKLSSLRHSVQIIFNARKKLS